MIQFIKLFLPTAVFCFVVDLLWLGVIAKKLYDGQIGLLLRKTSDGLDPNWLGVIIVYIAIVTGVLVFALPKGQNQYGMTLLWGALFGLVLYATYDFTNYALLLNWPLLISVIDVMWGMFLCGTTACFALFVKKHLLHG